MMFKEPLSEESKESLRNFSYKSTDDSIVYNYVISPLLNKYLYLLPIWLAPNVLTIMSLIFNIISFILTYYEAKWDFTIKLSPTVTLIQAAMHYLYIILDNWDGKQARRTGTSSPFGMLLDHGCDVFTNIIVCFNVCHLLQLNQNSIYPLFCFIALYAGFYATAHEGYSLGELHLTWFNGPDEGNVLVATGSLFGWLFGNDIWTKPVTILSSIMTINVAQLIISLIFFGSICCDCESLIRIKRKKGIHGLYNALIWEWLPFYNVILLPFISFFFNYNFYIKYYWLILLCISSLYARLIIEMHIKLCTNLRLNILDDKIVMIGNGLIIICMISSSIRIKEFMLALATILLSLELTIIILQRGNEIMDCLGIKLLTIVPKIDK